MTYRVKLVGPAATELQDLSRVWHGNAHKDFVDRERCTVVTEFDDEFEHSGVVQRGQDRDRHLSRRVTGDSAE